MESIFSRAGGRKEYDASNETLEDRRRMIRAESIRIATIKKEAYTMAEQKRKNDENATSARGRLGNLVKEPTRRVMPVFESQWKLNNKANMGVNHEEDEEQDAEENVDVEKNVGEGDDFADNH